MPTILLTGATGYIGSHTWLALLAAGYDVVGVDDFSNSSPEVLARLHMLAGARPVFERADVADLAAMRLVFAAHAPDAVVHFAARKAVCESVAMPLDYYANNLGGLLAVCRAMREQGCRRFVFSSSATVYGDPARLPLFVSGGFFGLCRKRNVIITPAISPESTVQKYNDRKGCFEFPEEECELNRISILN